METKQNYNGDIKTEMEELQKLELTVELEEMAWSTCCLLYTSPSPRDRG